MVCWFLRALSGCNMDAGRHVASQGMQMPIWWAFSSCRSWVAVCQGLLLQDHGPVDPHRQRLRWRQRCSVVCLPGALFPSPGGGVGGVRGWGGGEEDVPRGATVTLT
jgi:hypothetical protein